MELLNPKCGYVDNDGSLLALDAVWDIYALAIHNIKLSRDRQADKFLTYTLTEFNFGDKVLLRNHTRDVWDLKYDVVYQVAWVMEKQLELMDESGKTCKVNVLSDKIT